MRSSPLPVFRECSLRDLVLSGSQDVGHVIYTTLGALAGRLGHRQAGRGRSPAAEARPRAASPGRSLHSPNPGGQSRSHLCDWGE